jgi:DNA-directed RNA polymerase subunit K/omega
MYGRWDVGHHSPLHLPTSRGFDTFLGYLAGDNYYWSKRNPDHTNFHDIFNSTESCYEPYREDDMHQYSTFFYRDKAIELINSHNFESKSMFLLMSFQAVHDPFTDKGKFTTGMPDAYFDDEPTILSTIHSEVKGKQRQEYIKSLYMLDKSIGQIYDKLEETEDYQEEIEDIEEVEDEEEEENDDELKIFDEDGKECEVDNVIEDDNEYFDNEDDIEVQPDTTIQYVKKEDRISAPKLTKYEMVRILGERCKQLTTGAKPLIKNHQRLPYDRIAEEELKVNMIPFKIRRPLPNGKYELWTLDELKKDHLMSLLEE